MTAPKTPQQKMAEIEKEIQNWLMESTDCEMADYYKRDVPWLIARTKQLEYALKAMILAARDHNCGLRIADEALSSMPEVENGQE